jgi:AAA family ATP:ADP antiporter
MDNKKQEMSRLRLAILPVADEELGKFLPMCGMIFLTIFAYSLLRAYKDTIVVQAPGAGPLLLPFLKTYTVLPSSLLAAFGYMKLRKNVDASKAYYICVSLFIAFFALFALVLNPYREYLHLGVDWLMGMQEAYPPFSFFFAIVAYWSYALFYVASELWGTYMLSVLFWQFANETTTPEQSKRYYPLYVLAGNLALIALFPVLTHISNNTHSDVLEVCGLVSVCGFLLMYFYTKADTAQRKEAREEKIVKKKKKKLTMLESFGVLFRSEYVGYIAVLVLAYGSIITLVELIWKSQAVQLYPTKQSWLQFQGYYTLLTGLATILMNYLSKGVIRQFGWLTGAIITPIAAGLLSCLFFIFILGQSAFASIGMFLDIAPLTMAVWVGTYAVLLTKGSKYSFFDPTKEMAFIPLEPDLKINGKAAVDGVGGRLGKSMGSLISSTLIMIYSTAGTRATAMDIAPVLFVVVLGFTLAWFFSVVRLSVLYNRETRLAEEAQAAATA